MQRNKLLFLIIFTLVGLISGSCLASKPVQGDYVVLIHGLGRSAKSLDKLAKVLDQKGFDVLNIDYPSREHDIETLTGRFIGPAILNHCRDINRKVHFVTHSMGGIILRYHLQSTTMDNLGRIVMLSPPNRGSEVVDFLKNQSLIIKVMGPAFTQLGTDPRGFITTLTDMDAEVGVITGNRSINWINSIIIPGPDDGKVAVDRARLPSMQDFLVVKRTHPFIMNAKEVIEAIIQFINTGKFHVQ